MKKPKGMAKREDEMPLGITQREERKVSGRMAWIGGGKANLGLPRKEGGRTSGNGQEKERES
jgi:hypothetical protein